MKPRRLASAVSAGLVAGAAILALSAGACVPTDEPHRTPDASLFDASPRPDAGSEDASDAAPVDAAE